MPFSCEFLARVKYTLVNSSASLNVLSKFPRPNAIPRFGRDYVIVPRTRSAENKSPQEVSHGTRCMVNTRLPNCRSRKWTWAWCPPPKINLFEPTKKCYGDTWEFSKCWPITTGCPQNAKDGSMSNCWYVVSTLHQWKNHVFEQAPFRKLFHCSCLPAQRNNTFKHALNQNPTR